MLDFLKKITFKKLFKRRYRFCKPADKSLLRLCLEPGLQSKAAAVLSLPASLVPPLSVSLFRDRSIILPPDGWTQQPCRAPAVLPLSLVHVLQQRASSCTNSDLLPKRPKEDDPLLFLCLSVDGRAPKLPCRQRPRSVVAD